jgi:O-antigen/teichoic acid export membrane protein
MHETAESPAPEASAVAGAHQRSLGSDVTLTYASKVAVMALTLGMTIVVARALGPSGRGEVAVALALTLTLVQLGTLGFVSANSYFAARDESIVGRLTTNTLWFAAAAGVVLIAIGVAFTAEFPGATRGLGAGEVMAALLAIPLALATLMLQSVLLGQGRTVAYNAVELLQVFLVFCALAVGLFLLDFGVLEVLIVLASGYVVGVAANVVLLARHTRPVPRPDIGLVRKTLKYGLRIYLATLLAFLVIRVDVFLVNSYLGSVEAGKYSVVVALAEGIYLLPTVVGLNLAPRVARGAPVEASASVFRIMFLLYGAFCLVSVPLAAPGIELVFGPEFSDAAGLYYWIVPGVFCLGMLTILAHHFAGRGFPIEAALVWIGGLAVNLAINVAFLADQGTYIASLASSVAYGFLLLLHVRLFAHEAGGYRSLVPSIPEAVDFLRGLTQGLRRRGDSPA